MEIDEALLRAQELNIEHFVQRDRHGWEFMADIVANTDAEARRRAPRTIGHRMNAVDLFHTLQQVYGTGKVPESYGMLVSSPRFRTKGFPDRNVCNSIPDIWEINQTGKGNRSTKDRPGKAILSKMFDQMGPDLAEPPKS